jgi:UDP-N-acetylglucosamine/UDP-N-acetylgalactosamine diphosphorylase
VADDSVDVSTSVDEKRLRTAFADAGQDHVLAAWARLDDAGRRKLAAALARIDLELVERLGRLAKGHDNAPAPKAFAPPDVVALAEASRTDARMRGARRRGEALLAQSRVGFLLVAGGQASRLGFDGPKGAFPVGPVTGRTLFEIFARRLIAARERYGTRPAWYVMTSEANDAATRAIFAEKHWFGLERDDVFFFRQAMLPALDERGRILMSDETSPFFAPNGHGGVLSGLRESGALEHAARRGIEAFSYFQVDNPLARPADPLFLGLHAEAHAQMSSKVVRKRDAGEKVGVLGKVDGKLSCIEYSDLPEDLREARDDSGELVFGAGNIALHAIERAFVEELTRGGLRLPWHVARKSVDALDDSGRRTSRPAFKFETFVFDALAFAARSVTLEVDRAVEFSPVKNAQGEDSPATARAAQCDLYSAWVRRAGLPLPPRGADGHHPVEVDPVLAEDMETFVARAPRAPQVSDAGHFYA